MAAARISNIADLVYSIYQHGPHFTLRRIELIDASMRSRVVRESWRIQLHYVINVMLASRGRNIRNIGGLVINQLQGK
jgi:hypothetical protein